MSNFYKNMNKVKFLFNVDKDKKNELMGYLKKDGRSLSSWLVEQMENKIKEYKNDIQNR